MIRLNHIDVVFKNGPEEVHALKNLSLKVNEGEFITVIGSNGAGKSTLMNLLSGDIIPKRGTIQIGGTNVTRWPQIKRAKLIARVFQNPNVGTFSDLTVEENMAIALKRGTVRGLKYAYPGNTQEKFKELLSHLKLGLERRMNDKVSSLSGGQKQALSLIMSTLNTSKILLLDEHTAALDPKTTKTIMNITRDIMSLHNLTAIMITHSMHDALEFGDRTIVLSNGHIVADLKNRKRKSTSPSDLLKWFEV